MFEGKLPYNVKTVTFFSKMFWRTAEINRKNPDFYIAFVVDAVFAFCFVLLFSSLYFFWLDSIWFYEMVLEKNSYLYSKYDQSGKILSKKYLLKKCFLRNDALT